MNNEEIKEILDKPKILMLSYGNYISLDDYVKLKHYITNLQDTLKDREEYCYGLETQLTNLQEELENKNNEIDVLKDQVEWWKQQCDDLEMQIGENNG